MFFSVKTTLKIGDKVYIPCICYTAPKELELTINKLASEGKAVIYDKKVAFQNGKVLPSVEERIKAKKKEEKETKKKVKNTEKDESEGF